MRITIYVDTDTGRLSVLFGLTVLHYDDWSDFLPGFCPRDTDRIVVR